MFMPGTCTTVKPTPIAMNENLNFAIREGGKTVGAGEFKIIMALRA